MMRFLLAAVLGVGFQLGPANPPTQPTVVQVKVPATVTAGTSVNLWAQVCASYPISNTDLEVWFDGRDTQLSPDPGWIGPVGFSIGQDLSCVWVKAVWDVPPDARGDRSFSAGIWNHASASWFTPELEPRVYTRIAN